MLPEAWIAVFRHGYRLQRVVAVGWCSELRRTECAMQHSARFFNVDLRTSIWDGHLECAAFQERKLLQTLMKATCILFSGSTSRIWKPGLIYSWAQKAETSDIGIPSLPLQKRCGINVGLRGCLLPKVFGKEKESYINSRILPYLCLFPSYSG